MTHRSPHVSRVCRQDHAGTAAVPRHHQGKDRSKDSTPEILRNQRIHGLRLPFRKFTRPEQQNPPTHQKRDAPERSDHPQFGEIGERENVERSGKEHHPPGKGEASHPGRSREESQHQQSQGMHEIIEHCGFPRAQTFILLQEFIQTMGPQCSESDCKEAEAGPEADDGRSIQNPIKRRWTRD